MSSSCLNQSAHLSLNLKFYHLNYKSVLFHSAFTNINVYSFTTNVFNITISVYSRCVSI